LNSWPEGHSGGEDAQFYEKYARQDEYGKAEKWRIAAARCFRGVVKNALSASPQQF
jgi:hypothetical protein